MKNLNQSEIAAERNMESSLNISRSHQTLQTLQSPQHVVSSLRSTSPHHGNINRNLNMNGNSSVNQMNNKNLYNMYGHQNDIYQSQKLSHANGNSSSHNNTMSLPRSFKADKFEIPLPFGYHMDLDFLRFCSDELVSDETLEKLKDLRKARRQQRKTLEALMGTETRTERTEEEDEGDAVASRLSKPLINHHGASFSPGMSPGVSPSTSYKPSASGFAAP